MKQLLLTCVLITLSGCGSASAPQPGTTSIIETNGNVQYTLTVTDSSGPVVFDVVQAVAVTFPSSLQNLSDASWLGRLDLSLGNVMCGYDSDGHGLYVLNAGTCNTQTPNAAVILPAGTSITLAMEGTPPLPTGAEAIVRGVAQ